MKPIQWLLRKAVVGEVSEVNHLDRGDTVILLIGCIVLQFPPAARTSVCNIVKGDLAVIDFAPQGLTDGYRITFLGATGGFKGSMGVSYAAVTLPDEVAELVPRPSVDQPELDLEAEESPGPTTSV